MDKAVAGAMQVWNEYLDKYPTKALDKNFLINNIALIHSMAEALVPNIIKDNVELDDDLVSVLESYHRSMVRQVTNLVSVSDSLSFQCGCVETSQQLEDVLVGIRTFSNVAEVPCLGSDTGSSDASDPDENGKLPSPLWCVCCQFPNDSMTPYLMTHGLYTRLFRNCKNKEEVDFQDLPLFDTSAEVSDLLDELGLNS